MTCLLDPENAKTVVQEARKTLVLVNAKTVVQEARKTLVLVTVMGIAKCHQSMPSATSPPNTSLSLKLPPHGANYGTLFLIMMFISTSTASHVQTKLPFPGTANFKEARERDQNDQTCNLARDYGTSNAVNACCLRIAVGIVRRLGPAGITLAESDQCSASTHRNARCEPEKYTVLAGSKDSFLALKCSVSRAPPFFYARTCVVSMAVSEQMCTACQIGRELS